MADITRLQGGMVYDPEHEINGVVMDLYFSEGRMIAPVNPADITHDINVRGKIIMAGAIDIHSHIAGGNVNTARLITPDSGGSTCKRCLVRRQANGRHVILVGGTPSWDTPPL